MRKMCMRGKADAIPDQALLDIRIRTDRDLITNASGGHDGHLRPYVAPLSDDHGAFDVAARADLATRSDRHISFEDGAPFHVS